MKKARILSSESDASIKIKQQQDTNIDLSIAPPAQSVNFQPCAMADLASMASPATVHRPSTFNPILAEEPLIQRSHRPIYLQSSLMRPVARTDRKPVSVQTGGQSVPASEQITVKASQSREEAVISRDIEEEREEVPVEPIEEPIVEQKPVNEEPEPKQKKEPTTVEVPIKRSIEQLPVFEERSFCYGPLPTLKRSVVVREVQPQPKTEHIDTAVLDGPFIEPEKQTIDIPDIKAPIPTNDIPIIDELKRPMEVLQKPVAESTQQMQAILKEKTKRANVLEAMLEIYENKHQTINGLLTCKHQQLEGLVKAYTGATSVELLFEDDGGCGCIASGPKLLDVESIIVNVGGKSFDFRFGFNDAYADMVRHGVNLKQVIA